MQKYIRQKTIVVILSIVIITSCESKKRNTKKSTTSTYISKYPDLYARIDSTIEVSWKASLVPASDKLPFPFLSIAKGRSIIFYWDSYFTNTGLFYHKDVKKYAKNATDNLLHEVEVYGFVPNASEPWGTNRSQPAYLSMMVREVYENMVIKDTAWLKKSFYTLKKEYHFWMDDSENAIEKNATSIEGLVRYYHHANAKDLITMYDHIAERFHFNKDIPNSEKVAITNAYAAEAESGMDFTPRFEDRCPDFIALDLNSNLYANEINFAWIKKELGITDNIDWLAAAEKRKALVTKYCWSEKRGLFLDYDYVNKRHSKVAAATSFSPLLVGLATKEQAKRTRDNLSLFEMEYGVAVCEKTEQKKEYQWDAPAGWPPLQYLTIKALDKYGFKKDALRIANKYLDLVAKNYARPQPLNFIGENGKQKTRQVEKVYEKYDCNKGLIYDAEYASRPFMGWSTGVYVFAYNYYLNTKK